MGPASNDSNALCWMPLNGPVRPMINETMKRITNTTSRTFAIQAASPAMPPNPNAPAMIGGDCLTTQLSRGGRAERQETPQNQHRGRRRQQRLVRRPTFLSGTGRPFRRTIPDGHHGLNSSSSMDFASCFPGAPETRTVTRTYRTRFTDKAD